MTRKQTIVATAALICAWALVQLGGPVFEAYVVRTRVLPRLAMRLGRPVRVAAVKAHFGRVELDDLEIDGQGQAPPLVVPGVRVHFSVAGLLRGRAEVSELELFSPRIELVRGGADDNVSSLLDRLSSSESSSDTRGRSALRIEKVTIRGGALAAAGDWGVLDVGRVDGELVPHGPASLRLYDVRARLVGGPTFGATQLTILVNALDRKKLMSGTAPASVEVTGGWATPVRGFRLTDVHGAVRPDPADAARLAVELHGSYGGAGTELWTAFGSFHPATRDGELQLRAARFRLSQLDSVWSHESAARLINAHDAEVDAGLDLRVVDGKVGFSAKFHLSGLTVAHPMLGPVPVANLGFDASAQGRLDPVARSLILDGAEIDYRHVHALFTGTIENIGRRPRFAARLQIQPLPCQAALTSLPAEMTPYLQDFKLSGTFSTDLHLGIDFADFDTIDLGGQVGIEGCRVVQPPKNLTADRLMDTFTQTVQLEPGRWRTFLAGPENPDFVPYADISPYLINSIMTTEDSGFFKHRGFIPSEFRSALQQNLQRGYFRLGASSITMQMIKNVLLTREKTLSRKLQELFLTWYVEHHLTKERILEIYFNVIEFGPDVYGIGAASRRYFGKPAKLLTPMEAAWFSSILPNPKRRYVQYCHSNGLLDTKWDTYVRRILRRVHERGRLSDEDYEKAVAVPLQFDRAEAMPERECMALVKHLTTPVTPPMEITRDN